MRVAIPFSSRRRMFPARLEEASAAVVLVALGQWPDGQLDRACGDLTNKHLDLARKHWDLNNQQIRCYMRL
jgi:hypothetical protein